MAYLRPATRRAHITLEAGLVLTGGAGVERYDIVCGVGHAPPSMDSLGSLVAGNDPRECVLDGAGTYRIFDIRTTTALAVNIVGLTLKARAMYATLRPSAITID